MITEVTEFRIDDVKVITNYDFDIGEFREGISSIREDDDENCHRVYRQTHCGHGCCSSMGGNFEAHVIEEVSPDGNVEKFVRIALSLQDQQIALALSIEDAQCIESYINSAIRMAKKK